MKRFGILCVLLVAASTARADEGMWPFDRVPKAEIQQKCGVELTDPWLTHLQLSTVRLGTGCTGSFISPNGLVLTNHHCAQDALVEHSTAERDMMARGYLARTPADELPCSAYEVSVLVAMEDVTDKVEAATAGLDEQAANQARKKALTQLEKAAEEASKTDKKTGPLVCQSVTLYDGGQYFLYKYKRYTDVRLVFAPENDIADFGGDPDNFQYPRYDLDMAILRAYENGKPARTPNYLKINFSGAAEGEPVFVSGHPGSTDRQLTVSQLQTLRDMTLPRYLILSSELRGRMLQFSMTGEEANRTVQDALLGLENSLKVRRKELDALLDENLMAAKRADEDSLRARVAADPALAAATGDAWGGIARAQETARAQGLRHFFIEESGAFRGDLYRAARALVRGAAERTKPNEERLREYTDSRLPYMRQRMLAPSPIYPAVEKLQLTFSLERMREWLGPDDPVVQKVLGKESPAALAARLVDGTKLADPAARKALWDGGAAAVQASDDPMVALAVLVDPDARALRKLWEDEVEAPVTVGSEKIARARFAAYGTSLYPDATFTLRLNFGTVQGWMENGAPVKPFTTLGGAFDRATGEEPFRMPKSWEDAKATLALETPFNVCTNNDIVGGNSGSPVVNARGELVGLMFDGNIHSISGSYWFDTARNRATGVHPAAMKEALSKVYKAEALLAEMGAAREKTAGRRAGGATPASSRR